MSALIDLTNLEYESIVEGYLEGKQVNYLEFYKDVISYTYDASFIIGKINELIKRYKLDLQYIFKKYDADKDGKLNLLEFDSLLVSVSVKLPDEELNEAY